MSQKFLLKIGEQLRVVPSKKLEEFNINQIFNIAVASTAEQRNQLVRDSKAKNRKTFYGRNVVEELERSIRKLEEKIPNLRDHVKSLIDHKISVNN